MTSKELTQNDAAPIKNGKTLNIEGNEYIYSITKTELEGEILIKLLEKNINKNITFIYKASSEKIVKDIKALCLCENIEEIINSLQNIFDNGNIFVEKKDEKYFLKIEAMGFGKISKYELELEKDEPFICEDSSIINKIKEFDNRYQELKKDIQNLKNTVIEEIKKELNIKESMKEILKDQEIKDIIFNIFEEKISKTKKKEEKCNDELFNSKLEASINTILNKKYSKKVEETTFNKRMEKIKENFDNQLKEINVIKENYKNINIKEEPIIKDLNEQIKKIKEKFDTNYITLKVKIEKKDIGKNIKLLRQCQTYKFFKNFELDDIEVLVNGEIIPIKYKHEFFHYDEKEYNCMLYKENSSDEEDSKKIYRELKNNYYFYWNFFKEGVYDVKIIFKKKLSSCEGLFDSTNCIIEIDLSKFDCSKVISCFAMFAWCEETKKINFGKLDFSQVTNFSYMFYCCKKLIDLNMTNFNTKNSITFREMFRGCECLKKIDVSRFNSSKCETFNHMFYGCKSITEIDMIDWDMSSLKYHEKEGNPINSLFESCSNLKKIKISGNLNKNEATKDFNGTIFKGIPENGDLVTKEKVICNIPLDGYLPQNWSRNKQ